MDELELFDEFGNLIETSGATALETTEEPLQKSEDESDDDMFATNEKDVDQGGSNNDEPASMKLVSRQRFGEDVQVLIETENTQTVDEPLVKPQQDSRLLSKQKQYATNITQQIRNGNYTTSKKNNSVPKIHIDREYLLDMCKIPERIRNVAILGPLHSGKTSLVDLLVYDSHQINTLPGINKSIREGWVPMKYMDTFKQEISRGLSTKLNGITMLATDLNDKSVVINLIDTPGHVNFLDEVAVALEATDVAIICIDVIEGITSIVEQLIRQCERINKQIVFVLNKIDRLILELKLPSEVTYMKLVHLIGTINKFTRKSEHSDSTNKYSPSLNNIIFASAKLGFTFSLEEFIMKYYSKPLSNRQINELIENSWSQEFFHDFVLLPLYKIITLTLTNDNKEELTKTLKKYVPTINSTIPDLYKDPLPILKYVLSRFFGERQTGLYTTLQRMNSPIYYGSTPNSDRSGNRKYMLAHVLKTLDYCGEEYSMVKLYCGELRVGDKVKIVGEDNREIDEDDEEDENEEVTVTQIALMGGRYIYDTEIATPGQIVLIKGIGEKMEKCGTIYKGNLRTITETHLNIKLLREIDYINDSCYKIIIEPLRPKELPKLLDSLALINKYYPGVTMKVEESSEHVIIGTGELYLDCLLYDLRNNYGQMEIKVSDPMTIFAESCNSESFASIPVDSSDGRISISVGASPLDSRLIKDVNHGKICLEDYNTSDDKTLRKLSKLLRTEYGWDSLLARNVWTFSNENINTLIDDTLSEETDKEGLTKFKNQIKQGFYWAIREGPLCEESIYGIQFRLLTFNISKDDDEEGKEDNLFNNAIIGNQLIPMIRKACYIALLTAEPVLMEPIYEIDITAHKDYAKIVEALFHKRRGTRMFDTRPIAGTPFMELRGQVPVIESNGLETDLRTMTQGQAMCQMHFINKIWRRVPGDVMDREAIVPKLKPAPRDSLSRDFVIKTRRRKGISDGHAAEDEGPSLSKYISPALFRDLATNGYIQS